MSVSESRAKELSYDERACYIADLFVSRRNSDPIVYLEIPIQEELLYRIKMYAFRDINKNLLFQYLENWLTSCAEYRQQLCIFTAFCIHFIKENIKSHEIDGFALELIKDLMKKDYVIEFLSNPEIKYMIRILMYREFSKTVDSSVGMARLYFIKVMFDQPFIQSSG